MFPAHRTTLRQWVFAVLMGALAVVARAVVQAMLGDALPFILAFPAVALVSLLWGTGPGLLAAAVCAFGVWLPNIPPTIVEGQRLSQLGWFALSAAATPAACGRLRVQPQFLARPDLGASRETSLSAWLQAVLWGALFLPISAFVAASWWSLDRAESEARAAAISSGCATLGCRWPSAKSWWGASRAGK